jgi:Bacterial alpha-L-rhamnosidase 6 hairpin glycosidase domain/Bacterial alpha-L-rhamnosidase C-terminal domain
MFESCRAHFAVLRGCLSCRAQFALLVAALVAAPAATAATGTGSFTSSDPLLNRIWTGSVRTAQDMLVRGPLTADWLGRPCRIDVPTAIIDGVVRDRCPYIGDESVIDRTLDASQPSWPAQRSMLVWFAQAQRADGAIPASPLNGGTLLLFDYSAYWVQVLHTYVLYSGDVALARRLWPHVVRVLDGYYAAHTGPAGLLVNDLGAADYGYIRRHGAVVAYYNALYVAALRDAAQVASWTGQKRAASRWTARAAATARATAAAFWDPVAGAFSDTTVDRATHPQDGNAFAVLSGVGTRAQALSALAYLERRNARDYGNTIADTNTWAGPDWGGDAANRVYPFMSYYELAARFQTGLVASAFDLLRREWGYMLREGPGTMWETIGPYGGPPTDVHPSYDSGWSSGAAAALTQYVLGVTPTSPGFATFAVAPHAYDLSSLAGTVPTPHGPIRVSWRKGGRLVVHAPHGAVWARGRRR